MGQKVNPISLRLQQTNRHFDSCWYSDYFYSKLITRDLKLQNYFNSILKQLEYPRGRFFIQNFQNKLKIHLFFCNPKVSRNSRSAFFRLPKPKLKSRLKAKNFKINKMETSNIVHQNINNMKDYLPSQMGRIGSISNGHEDFTKQLIFYSSNNFLNSYSIQNKKQSIFVFYLLKNLRMVRQQDNLQQQDSNIIITHDYNQLLIRYTILNCFSLRESNLIVNKYILLFKTGLFQWFTKKYIVFLILNYIKFKLYTYQTKSKNNGDSNTIRYHERCNIGNVHYEKNDNMLDETTCIQKEKTLQALLKMINKQAAKNINQRKHKINNLFFKPQFKAIKTFNSSTMKKGRMSEFRISNSKEFRISNSKELRISNSNESLQNKIHATNECVTLVAPKVDFFKTNRIYKSNKKNFVLKNSDFREHLESLLSAHFNLTVNTFFYLVSKESQCALFLADEIAYYLEKRVSFRAIKNKIMKEIQQSEHPFFKGIRITCSGRVGGKSKKAQRSKIQTFKYGQTSLHVFSSKIDFAFKNANTSFGQVGVKIWVCYDVI